MDVKRHHYEPNYYVKKKVYGSVFLSLQHLGTLIPTLDKAFIEVCRVSVSTGSLVSLLLFLQDICTLNVNNAHEILTYM